MRKARLGRRGPRVPAVALGTWQLGGRLWGPAGPGEAEELVSAAAEHGLLFFDTAEIYGAGRSEELLGQALRRRGVLGEAFIVTKVAGWRVTWRGVWKALRGSAARLGRAPDMVLYHWPPPLPFTPCRAARLLERALEEGLVSWIGVSNFNAAELEEAQTCLRRAELLADQVHYSLAYRVPENMLVPTAERLGVTVMAWGPLAKGALAGKTSADNMARRLDPVFRRAARDHELQRLLASAAERLGAPRASVALAWLVSRGAVPVAGARRRSHVEAAARALELSLPRDIAAALDEATRRYRGRGCYRELHWNRFIPPPLQALIYRAMGGV